MNLPRNLMQFSRFFHTSNVLSRDRSASLMSRSMNKLLRGSNKVKKKWYNPIHDVPSSLPTVKSLTDTRGQHGKVALRRTTVLNKLFMRHISDQMSSGAISSKIFGRGIEISRIRVTNDFQKINVFWLAKGTPEDDKTETILFEVAGLLRHELSQLKLMGQVPKISFVKDKQLAKFMEVEIQLAKADYGEDYDPVDRSYLLKNEFMLNSKLDPTIKEKIKDIENEEEIEEVTLPIKSQAIFGLDREQILNRITSSISKSKNAWAGNTSNEINLNPDLNAPRVETLQLDLTDRTDRSDLFKEFLRQRKVAQRKAEKAMYDDLKLSEPSISDDELDDEHLLDKFDLYDEIEFEDKYTDLDEDFEKPDRPV